MSRVPGILLLIAVALVWAAGYWFVSIFWPFANCRKCDGNGKFRSPSGKAWRNCRRCKGTGARLRIGRRVWNRVHQARREAAK